MRKTCGRVLAFFLALLLALDGLMVPITPVALGLDYDMPAEEAIYTDDETAQADEEPVEQFVIPEDAACEDDAVLVDVPEGTSEEDVLDAIVAQDDGVAQVEEVVPGTMRVVAQEGSVEQMANDLLESGIAESAQPNYIYVTADEADVEPERAAEEETPLEVEVVPGEQDTNEVEVSAEPELETSGEDAVVSDSVEVAHTNEAANDPSLTTAATTNDPYRSKQWAIDSIRAKDAWDLAKASGSVTVAVIDAGCMVNHEDLAANIDDWYNAAKGTKNVTPDAGSDYTHGTHVAGIISAVSNNGVGISGVSYNAKVLPIRVTNSNGEATTSSLLRAYDYAIARRNTQNVRVINLSMCMSGTLSVDEGLLAKIDEAFDSGIVSVVASGNGSSGSEPFDSYPGDYRTAVSVINLQKSGSGVSRSSTSNYNVAGTFCKNISAPGTDIYSTVTSSGKGSYGHSSGTSMATPVVSGVLALEFAANPSLSAKDAVEILYATASDIGTSGWDESYGFGEVNAYEAVRGARYGVSADKISYVRNVESRVDAARNSQALNSLRYRTRMHSSSWQAWKGGGTTSGAVGKSKSLECMKLTLSNSPYAGSIQYRSQVQSSGWQAWKQNGAMSGKKGKRIEAIQIRLTGEMAKRYDVYYRVYAKKFGWMGWTCNGEAAGTSGYSYRLEGIQVVLRTKGSGAPGSTARAFRFPVSYRAYVQDRGWRKYVKDGKASGTKGKRLEAMSIKLAKLPFSGSIKYRVRMQGKGWQGWKKNGKKAGISGAGKRLEAVKIRLTGELANRYDVYYRVYAQRFGWMGWACNGQSAGTSGYSYRLEKIQIRLVPKGGKAPGTTARHYRKR